MAILQDDNVTIHQAQIVKTMVGSEHEESFSHMKLKVYGMCWRRLYRVMDSYNTRSSPKMDAPLDGNNITAFIYI